MRRIPGFLLGLILLAAVPAAAQFTAPRLGVSASPTAYVDSLTVELGMPFEVYICAFGVDADEPLDRPYESFFWGVHSVCCGALTRIVDFQFAPGFTHEGHPLAGVRSIADDCLQRDVVLLATLTVEVTADAPGYYLWAAGPFGPVVDCDGGSPVFYDMTVILQATGEVTAVEPSSWGQVKALYR